MSGRAAAEYVLSNASSGNRFWRVSLGVLVFSLVTVIITTLPTVFNSNCSCNSCSLGKSDQPLDENICAFALVIPTFPPHFRLAVRLLRSIAVFEVSSTPIVVVLSNNLDLLEFQRAAGPEVLNSLPVRLVAMENILNDEDYARFLKITDKYHTQGLKKVYGGLETGCTYWWMLDSEYIVLRTFSANKVLADYVARPYIPLFDWPTEHVTSGWYEAMYSRSLTMFNKTYSDFAPVAPVAVGGPPTARQYVVFPRGGSTVKWIMERRIVLNWIRDVQIAPAIINGSARVNASFLERFAFSQSEYKHAPGHQVEYSIFEMVAYLLFVYTHYREYTNFEIININDLALAFFGEQLREVNDHALPDEFIFNWFKFVKSESFVTAFINLSNYLRVPFLPAYNIDLQPAELIALVCRFDTIIGVLGDIPLEFNFSGFAQGAMTC